jgi:hypothetical protein
MTNLILKTQQTHESEQIMPENTKPGAQSAMKKRKKPGKAKDQY